jgi:hypothetical protein
MPLVKSARRAVYYGGPLPSGLGDARILNARDIQKQAEVRAADEEKRIGMQTS